MHRSRPALVRLTIAVAFAMAAVASAQAPEAIRLPQPKTDGGRPLMEVLKDRHSSRQFGAEKLPAQTLSNLLWAAFGVNRPDGRRTAPSARNWQEIDVYVATADGAYLYDPKAHALAEVTSSDVRAFTGTQDFVGTAPANLIYVADYSKVGNAPAEERELFTAIDAGFIGQNVYLFCASEGLVTVVRGLIDRPALARVLKLRADQRIILAQSVGYPPK
jgi:SagB-type dehydrogenase family enzyme